MAERLPMSGLQILECAGLCGEFLDPILAEQTLSRAVGFPDAFRRLGLADRHQCDFIRSAPGMTRSPIDTLAHRGKVFGDRHKSTKPRRTRSCTQELLRASLCPRG